MRTIAIAIIGSLIASAQLSCRDNTPPPRHVPVPLEYDRSDPRVYRHDPRRPLPPPEHYSPADYPPFEDAPLLTQQPPEQRRFVEAYDAVGRPRIVVFMNRTFDGQIIPVVEHEPIAAVEHRRRSTTGVTVERSDRRSTERGYRYEGRDTTDRFESTGPAEYTETTEVYLPRGRYDEAMARSLDYEAMEQTLTDWLAAGGRVVMISPGMARQRLTDEQLKELQDGRPQMLLSLIHI